MSGDDPGAAPGTGGNDPQSPSFWSSVTWPRRQLAVALVAGSGAVFGAGLLYGRPGLGALAAAAMLPVVAAAWALQRVVKAWAEWPARRRWVAWLKAAVRYVLTDP